MNNTMSSRKRPFVRFAETIVFLIVGVIGLIVVLAYFQPHIEGIMNVRANSAELDRIRAELPDAKARWDAQGIADYDVDVSAFTHLGCFVTDTTLSVRKGALVSATRYKFSGTALPAPEITLSLDYGKPVCPLENLLPSTMFKMVERSLDIDPFKTAFEVDFDPDYGFVTKYYLYTYGTDGVANFTFSNFRPIPDSSAK